MPLPTDDTTQATRAMNDTTHTTLTIDADANALAARRRPVRELLPVLVTVVALIAGVVVMQMRRT